jgi:hypothetical protein
MVECELFLPGFNQCPVYDYRPALCRMHFCHQFDVMDSSLVKDLGDIFLDGLIEAGRRGSQKVMLFDSPPLGRLIPEFLKSILPQIEAVKAGTLDEANARGLINLELKRFFHHCEPG